MPEDTVPRANRIPPHPKRQKPDLKEPSQQVLGQQVPSQQVPSQQVPSQQMPGQQVPGQQAPGQQVPVQQVLGNPPQNSLQHDLESRPKRIFFALLPDPGLRRQLLAYRKQLHCDGRPVHPEDLHLTLLFLGQCPEQKLQPLLTAAATLRWESFPLRLEHCDCPPGNRILWLTPRVAPAPLLKLVSDLRKQARRCKLNFAKRPYLPHLTLLRNARPGLHPDPQPPLSWQVKDFVLAESIPGKISGVEPLYRVLGHWPATTTPTNMG